MAAYYAKFLNLKTQQPVLKNQLYYLFNRLKVQFATFKTSYLACGRSLFFFGINITSSWVPM